MLNYLDSIISHSAFRDSLDPANKETYYYKRVKKHKDLLDESTKNTEGLDLKYLLNFNDFLFNLFIDTITFFSLQISEVEPSPDQIEIHQYNLILDLDNIKSITRIIEHC